MKAFLLYRDRDFVLQQPLPPQAEDLISDLGLPILFDAMAAGDGYLLDVATKVVLSSLLEPAAITYRQRILDDCLKQPAVIRDLYDLAVEAIDGEKHLYGGFFGFRSPNTVLHRSVEALQFFVGMLKRLRQISDEQAACFESDGFRTFFQMLSRELDDEYFAVIEDHLKRMKFRNGVLVSAELGDGGKGARYVLRTPLNLKRGWLQQISGRDKPESYTLTIPDRDEAGANALSELRDRGINLVANALAQSTDHILSFFEMLRCELGFYVSCLNLRECLSAKEEPVCFPEPLAVSTTALSFRGIYDVGLALTIDEPVVGNDVDADEKSLIVLTGANTGGKSTLLRGVGLAQLMMQAGMFVGAQTFRANTCVGLFTHYKREEDSAMESGKFDEELNRMNDIAGRVTPGSMVLFNESFAATNEREGSEIARQIIRALRETHVKVLFVTHFFDLADSLYRQHDEAIFLRAERRPDGQRTFKLREGEPLPTSYGKDLYARVFETGDLV